MQQRRKQLQSEETITNKAILPQYDDEDEEETEKRRKSRITLAGDGGVGLSKEQMLEELREKMSMKGKTKVSLEVTKVFSHYV